MNLYLWDPTDQLVNIKHGISSSSHIIGDMERLRNTTYMRIYKVHMVALEGCVGRRKKKEAGLRCGGNCERKNDYTKRQFDPASAEINKKEYKLP
eukprot:3388982-Ditylum_brightwellii.AAC.1